MGEGPEAGFCLLTRLHWFEPKLEGEPPQIAEDHSVSQFYRQGGTPEASEFSPQPPAL